MLKKFYLTLQCIRYDILPKDTPLKEQVIEPQTFSGGVARAKLDNPTQIPAFNSGLRPIMKTMSLFIHLHFMYLKVLGSNPVWGHVCVNVNINGSLSLCVSSVIHWQSIQGVPHLSPCDNCYRRQPNLNWINGRKLIDLYFNALEVGSELLVDEKLFFSCGSHSG